MLPHSWLSGINCLFVSFDHVSSQKTWLSEKSGSSFLEFSWCSSQLFWDQSRISVCARLFLTEAREISAGPVWSFVSLSTSVQDKTEGPKRNLYFQRGAAGTHVYLCMCQRKRGKLLAHFLEMIFLKIHHCSNLQVDFRRLETHLKVVVLSSEGCDVMTLLRGNDRHQLLTSSVRGAVMKTNGTQDIVGVDDELTHLCNDHTVWLAYSYIVYVMRMNARPAVQCAFEVCFYH